MLWINAGQWAGNPLVRALFWTFLHSLWEGILLAAMAGVVMVLTRKAAASLRYKLFAALLVLFLCTTAVTFTIQVTGLRASTTAEAGTSGIYRGASRESQLIDSRVFTGSPAAVGMAGWPDRVTAWAGHWAPYLMAAWTLVFFVKCAQLSAGLYQVHRLRHIGTSSPGEEWEQLMRRLAGSLGVRRNVGLLQSSLAKVPLVIGHLKPLVLIPMGLLAHLPPDQLEAILLHELGHIRHSDYLVNLFQRIAETVFFFNPAVLWLSSLLRKEREYCCDDLVLRHSGNRRHYVDVLVSFQEYKASFVMPLGGKPLLGRVQRIISRENKPLNGTEKVLLILGILIVPVFGFMGKKTVNQKKPIPAAISRAPERIERGDPVRRVELAKQEHVTAGTEVAKAGDQTKGRAFAVADTKDMLPDKKDTVVEMAIPPGPEDFTNISRRDRSDADGSVTVLEATDNKGKKYVISKRDKHLTALTIDGVAIPEGQLESYSELADFAESVEGLHARNIPKDWEEEWLKYERLGVHLDHEIKKADNDMLKDPNAWRDKVQELRKEYEAALEHIRIEYTRKRRAANPLADVDPTIRDILADLRKQNLFTAPTDTSFVLGPTGLYLNGKKQAEDIYAPLKARFVHQSTNYYKYLDSAGSIQTWQGNKN